MRNSNGLLYPQHFVTQISALIKNRRGTFYPLSAISLVIILTLIAQIPLVWKVHIAEYDEAIFLDVASNIRQDGLPLRSIGAKGAFYFEHTPLYVYFLRYIPGGLLTARGVTVVFGIGCVLLVHHFVQWVTGKKAAAFISALLLGINSFFARYSFFVYMEVPMAFFLLLGLLLLIKGERKGILLLAGSGMAFAIAVLLKEIALLFVIVSGIYAFLRFRQHQRLAWQAVALVTFPAVIGLIAWGIWCWRLSPQAFMGTMQRWWGAATQQTIRDPRASIAAVQWARQIVLDLLDVGIVSGLVIGILFFLLHRKNALLNCILLGYPILAIALSFIIRLKELRHLIGVLPISVLFIGVNIDWDVLLGWVWSHRLRKAAGVIIAFILLFLASPLRVPHGNITDLRSWFDPLYAWRLFENDRYYNILRLAGLYLKEHTEPNEVITVLHEATVTAYYAERHYYMLYTASMGVAMRILERTRYLVWDHEVFLALTEEEVQAVREYVAQHFTVEQIVRDEFRQVIIYRRVDGVGP